MKVLEAEVKAETFIIAHIPKQVFSIKRAQSSGTNVTEFTVVIQPTCSLY